MSRAALYDALANDVRLQALGFHANTSVDPNADNSTILANYDGDQRPSDVMFMVLTWGDEVVELEGDDGTFKRTSRPVDIWVHCYKDFSSDFVRVDNVLKILDDIILNLVQVAGDDGYTLTMAGTGPKSRDLQDNTYQTICRSATYKILSRETV